MALLNTVGMKAVKIISSFLALQADTTCCFHGGEVVPWPFAPVSPAGLSFLILNCCHLFLIPLTRLSNVCLPQVCARAVCSFTLPFVSFFLPPERECLLVGFVLFVSVGRDYNFGEGFPKCFVFLLREFFPFKFKVHRVLFSLLQEWFSLGWFL